MNLSLDHLVHFTNASPASAAEILQKLGLHAVAGGRHELWGTHNSLCYFDLTYLEFLAIENRTVAENAAGNGLIKQIVADLPEREGVATVALRTNEIEQWAQRLKEKGLRVTGPLPGSRKRADGSVISWKMLFAETDNSLLPLPFLIEWGQSDEERRQDLTSRGIIAPHPAGDVRIKHVAYAVRQLTPTVDRLREIYGATAGEPYHDASLQATCQPLIFPGGDLLICSPTGPGVVADAIAAKGERPFFVQFAGAACRGEEHRIFGSLYRL